MTKSQFINVVIRLIGLFLLAYAALCLLTLVSGLVLLSDGPQAPSLARTLVVDSIMRITFSLIVGLYMIVDGGLFFSILDRED